MRVFIFTVLFFSFLQSAEHSWIQLNAQGKYEFRIVGVDSCPSIECDGIGIATQSRFEGSDGFRAKTCFADVSNCSKVSFGGNTREIKKSIDKVAFIGDTGCRIKIGKKDKDKTSFQECSDPNAWSAKEIAQTIASMKPDLVVHVGDYNYREKCDNKELCDKLGITSEDVGSGYNIWEKDFLEPFDSLLQSATFVFVRGNHENCDRSWEGYMSMLSPYPFARCKNSDSGSRMFKNIPQDAYRVEIGGFKAVIADSAGQNDDSVKHSDKEYFTKMFKDLKDDMQDSLFITHKPLYNLNFDSSNAQEEAYDSLNVESKAIISGHIHNFQYMENRNIKQVIVGNSGTKLDKHPATNNSYPKSVQIEEFGFVILDRAGDEYVGTLYSKSGERLYNFEF